MGTPKRTTRIPVAGERLRHAETLLSASLEAEAQYLNLTAGYDALPRRRFIRRRHVRDERFLALVRYWQAVRGARDIANRRTDTGTGEGRR